MSTKLAALDFMKYSSPMLRPPVMATWPSAMNSLLCMRRCICSKEPGPSNSRVIGEPTRSGSGLNSRTSTPSCAASAASSGATSALCRSSSSRRTRTPRSDASCSARSSWRPGAVVGQHVVLQVQRALGVACQRQARVQRLVAAGQQAQSAAGAACPAAWNRRRCAPAPCRPGSARPTALRSPAARAGRRGRRAPAPAAWQRAGGSWGGRWQSSTVS